MPTVELTGSRQRAVEMGKKNSKRGRAVVGVPALRLAYGELHDKERLSLTARLFCEGHSPSQIQKQLSERFGGEVRREEPYRLLQLGGALGYFHYAPPLEVKLGDSLRDEWETLSEAHVLQTLVLKDVTAHAAEVLLGLIRQEWKAKLKREFDSADLGEKEANTVRIGLAGGYTVLGIVRALVELLKREDPATLPRAFGFHTVCTGIHYHDSSTDPNAFISHLLRVPGIDVGTFAVPFQAPPVTDPDLRERLGREPLMKEARELFKLVDMIVTAGSSWRTVEITAQGKIEPIPPVGPGEKIPQGDEGVQSHSQLKELMQQADKRGFNRLVRAGTVGDLLWQPLTLDGPPEVDTKVKSMTLATLGDLPGFIREGGKVLLALGPYDKGSVHKGDVLLAALGQNGPTPPGGPLVTHVVCDHRTARAALKAKGRA